MAAWLLPLLLAVADPLAPDPATGPADTSGVAPRIVRQFPAFEVRAPLHDLRSSETVHTLDRAALRALPGSRLADVLALQPGVVVQAGETHVRGGRSGDVAVNLDGVPFQEPLRGRGVELPRLALQQVDLVSGAPEARHAASLAGALDVTTLSPAPRPEVEWRWQGDGGLDTRYDRVSGRVSTPLPRGGLGLVAAGDGEFDDTWLPALRTASRHRVAGVPLGWRAANRVAGWAKLAPTRRSGGPSLQVFSDRQVLQPYDPAWTLDGWVLVPANPKATPLFSPVPLPGYQRYRAADHRGIEDVRRSGAILAWDSPAGARRTHARLAWQRTRDVLSPGGGRRVAGDFSLQPRFDEGVAEDPFHVLWGDWPLYREGASDVWSAVAGHERALHGGATLAAGGGLTYEEVRRFEVDGRPFDWTVAETGSAVPVDSLRSFHAFAPGGFAWFQGRWPQGAMVLNAGLRAEVWTAGPQATTQTLPGSSRGVVTLSPRIGFAYPLSVRDAFSFAYVRLHQAPPRDALYDDRVVITDRQPLGNPALRPSTVISYEASVKHLFSDEWAFRSSVFYRDVFGQVGARRFTLPNGVTNLRYTDQDEGHATGFELALLWGDARGSRLDASYTWLTAWGNESRAEGEPYGPVRDARLPPISDRPLSWDRRHTLRASGTWSRSRDWDLTWATGVGSPLPWTPKPLRAPLTDLTTVNSRRLDWSEATDLSVRWTPRWSRGVTLGLEALNLFDHRGEEQSSVDGYPNSLINTVYDDYGAYRTLTGQGGGGYWSTGDVGGTPHWVPVHDPRLRQAPRRLRASLGARW